VHRKNPTVNFDRVFFASLLWLTTVGCAASLPDLKAPLAPDEQLISLPTRRNVTVRILLRTPSNSPKGTFLFFPGSEGSLVNNEGRPRWGYTRTFPELGFTTAIVDMPSDKPAWAGDRFRTSTEHVEDVKKIIEFVIQKWPKPIFLIGHSAGTISVGHVAATLSDERLNGIVLTGAPSLLARLPLHQIAYPALFVHHKDDTCASFQLAYEQHQRLRKSPRVAFIEALGGEPRSDIRCRRPDAADSPADPSQRKDHTHGFSGREREVVAAITRWAVGKPTPDRIGP
jgi:pimeloyl-ACP methyl ester carboxylesterase